MKDYNRENKYNEGLEDLLKDSPDYEDYTENVVVQKSCGGCSSGGCSSGGCSSGGCSSGGCSSGGCSSGGCCSTRK